MSKSMVLKYKDGKSYIHDCCKCRFNFTLNGAIPIEEIYIHEYKSVKEANEAGWIFTDKGWICPDCKKSLISDEDLWYIKEK